ncbi:PDZ domain-containing protein [Spongiactinospora sp. TRM90649]|uniref:YlbL family protein n=1 Tax=Spongiactinospora sp. TRM90649 TaxID=3031114 RepID=UPI0023F7511D|nr:PDZ domain-containing protein [Spongiactinospora sp. TRM90649]MDF5755545.1 PDZ domain-containing protein [Spongiactinospora sp. TRM90649]
MSRRSLTLMVAAMLTLMLGVAGALLPVPYVVLSPGPTEDTIGQVKGKPVISIDGRETYPTTGRLSLVTVAYQGGPGTRIDLLTALRGWIDPTIAVVPEETIFPKTSTAEQVEEQNVQDMTNSQDDATAAALTQLKIPYSSVVGVLSTEKAKPADGKLKPGDEIVNVDDKPAGDVEKVAATVRARKPGDEVVFSVSRDGQKVSVPLTTVKGIDGKPMVGVVMQSKFKFPFKVSINVGDVGGPSAGLMFSLGIVDKLTPGPLTGGKSIAGTGTITPEGRVGPIGGISQKMVGARKTGATVFLTPAENCGEAVKAVPSGLRLVRVETLKNAVDALDMLRTGNGTPPPCSAN